MLEGINKRELKDVNKSVENKRKRDKLLRQNYIESFDNVGKNNFTDQFNVLNFDSSGPSSINYDQDSNYSSIMNNENMTYNVTKKEHFQHNNMNHNTSARDFPVDNVSNQSVMQERLGIFTGTSDTFQQKKEVGPLFEPMKDLTYVNGAPNQLDLIQDRYLPSYMKNGENLPFASNMKVAPGLDGKVQTGLYDTTRFLPKTSNQLRNRNTPQTKYPGKKIETIKKGEYRGLTPTIETRKPMTYKVTSSDDMLPTMAHYREQRTREKFDPGYTNRSKSIHHSGPAKSSNFQNMPDSQKAKIRESNKIVYEADSISRNLTGEVKEILQNKKSMNLPNTRREATSEKTHHGGVFNKGDTKSYAVDRSDIPLTTLRQMMIDNPNILGVTATQNNEKGYVFDKNMVLPTTIKQTTVPNTRHGGAIGHVNKSSTYDPTDRPNVTIKQTTVGNTRTGGATGRVLRQTAYDPNDRPGVTVKQTTIGNTMTGGAASQVQKPTAYNPNDIPGTTLKDTTIHDNRVGIVDGQEGMYSKNPDDYARTTVKQTTVEKTYTGGITDQNDKNGGYLTNNVEAPVTHRQTMHTSHTGGAYDRQDKGYITNKMHAPTTTKETTMLEDYTGGMKHELDKQRTYEDVLNMETNQEKEKLAKGRKPTNRSYNIGPEKEQINVHLKPYVNNQRSSVPSHSLNFNTDQNLSSIYSRNKTDLHDTPAFRLDPSTLNMLKDNPYVNNLMFNKNATNNPYNKNDKC
jgi:hypothetical protein